MTSIRLVLILGLALSLVIIPWETASTHDRTPRAPRGCPAEYWIEHPGKWLLTGYSPDQTLGSVFIIAPALMNLEGATLAEALQFGPAPGLEGGARLLLRQATAALLNAVHPELHFPSYTPVGLLRRIATALTANRGEMLAVAAQLKVLNRSGCPFKFKDP